MQQIEKALNRDCKQLVGYLYLDLHHSLLCLDLQLLQIRYQLVRQEAFLKAQHNEVVVHLRMYIKSQMHLTQQVLTHQEDLAHLVVCLAKLVQLLLDLGVPQTLLINHHLDSTPAIQLIILLVQILLNKNLLEKRRCLCSISQYALPNGSLLILTRLLT
ncbi:uncharacterized protein LOC142327948 isoform X5 [Lycorma delicatula]|uniref:uncharacterized protein LOC142327948 isoform X5 n=1 Tax=Lycorma delicatula TaxID=130591 RepID=UPI003F518E44